MKYRKTVSVLGPALLIAGIVGLIFTFMNYERASDQRLDGILMWGSAAANGLIITGIVIYKRISR